jgi:hypothetical protein
MRFADGEFEVPDATPREGWVARWVADFEVLLGLVVACLVGLVGVGMMGFVYVVWEWQYGAFHIPVGRRIWLTLAWAVVTGCEIASVRWMGKTWPYMAYPRPVNLALAQRLRGSLVGAALAVWWIAHAVAIVATVEWIVEQYTFVNPTTTELAVTYATKFGLLFGGAYASTAFLLLGMGAIGGSSRASTLAWRWRVPLDLTVAAGLMMWGRG